MQIPSPLQIQQFRLQLKKFADFTDEEWDIFSGHFYVRQLKKKEPFISAEKVCNEIGFVSSGSLRFFFVKDGIEISTYFCFQNELISSYRSFLKRASSGICIDAMENACIICFSYDSLQSLLKDERTAFRMEHFGRTIAEYLICCYEERVLSFLSRSPEERYQDLLESQPAFLQKIPQHYIATYLGITAVSLSRIRKRIFNTKMKQKLVS